MNINKEESEAKKFNNAVNEVAIVIRRWLHNEPSSAMVTAVWKWRKWEKGYNYDEEPDRIDEVVNMNCIMTIATWNYLNAGQWIGQYGEPCMYEDYCDVWDSALYEATM